MATEGNEIDLNNIPDTPEAALALLAQIEAGGEPTASTPAPAAPAVAAAPVEVVKAASEPSTETQTGAAPSDEQAAGVATKDGKHVIPYSVLQSEREQKTRATQLAQEMADRVRTLEAALAASANGANPGAAARAAEAATAQAPAMSDADLEALKEDFPTVYKALQASMARSDALEAQLREQAGFKQEIEAASQRDVQDTVQEAIDSHPKLAHIQANDQAAFMLAQQFDETLKAHPAWADKPMAERFAKVIEMVEQTNGAITVPGGQPKPQQQTTNAADLKVAAKAAAAAQATAGKTNVPTSLSEFPVGDPPAQSETQALEQMSTFQIAAKLSRMTAEQQDAYFATL